MGPSLFLRLRADRQLDLRGMLNRQSRSILKESGRIFPHFRGVRGGWLWGGVGVASCLDKCEWLGRVRNARGALCSSAVRRFLRARDIGTAENAASRMNRGGQ